MCIQEYLSLLKEGHQLITIHANDPGAYGQDIGLSYPALLELLDKKTPTPAIKWSLCDVNPAWLIKHRDGLWPFFRKGRICHLGVPLQSGSPAILKRMRRNSRVDEIIAALKAFREADAMFSLTSHLIIGFPGETDEDRDRTFDVVCRAQFQRVYLFPFSANPNTPASRMENQHSCETIRGFMKSFTDRLSAASIHADVFS
jgi:tRNA A37 methylthiotransferase MiaB